jgi:hypothetical protein
MLSKKQAHYSIPSNNKKEKENKKRKIRLSMVVHICNLSVQEAEAGVVKFEYSTGCIARPCIIGKKGGTLQKHSQNCETSKYYN